MRSTTNKKEAFSIKVKEILKDKAGNSTPLIIAIVLILLILCCTICEFFRLSIIVSGVRDALQQSVISVAVTNYGELYNGLREGYSGGYKLSGGNWVEKLEHGDVYDSLVEVLGISEEGNYYVKETESGYEYRISDLNIALVNTPLAPGNTEQNFEADARIQIEIPLSFGWHMLPPFTMEVQTKAAYLPKF